MYFLLNSVKKSHSKNGNLTHTMKRCPMNNRMKTTLKSRYVDKSDQDQGDNLITKNLEQVCYFEDSSVEYEDQFQSVPTFTTPKSDLDRKNTRYGNEYDWDFGLDEDIRVKDEVTVIPVEFIPDDNHNEDSTTTIDENWVQ